MEAQILRKACEIAEFLGLNVRLNKLRHLSSAPFYFAVFRQLFPYLRENLEDLENSKIAEETKIQSLIDMLSNDVLTMDLSHIRGDLIVNSDEKGIWHFLEILDEIVKMCQQSEEEEQTTEYEYISSENIPEDLTSKEKPKSQFEQGKKQKSEPLDYASSFEEEKKENFNQKSDSEAGIDLDDISGSKDSEILNVAWKNEPPRALLEPKLPVEEAHEKKTRQEKEEVSNTSDHIFKSTEMQEFKHFLDQNIKQLKFRLKKLNNCIPPEISVSQFSFSARRKCDIRSP